MERDFVSWRGHRVHLNATGQGEPLLLITGLGGSTDQWRAFAQQFQNRRVIRFDVPGMGQSSAPLAPMTVAAVAELAVAVLALALRPLWHGSRGLALGIAGTAVASTFALDHLVGTPAVLDDANSATVRYNVVATDGLFAPDPDFPFLATSTSAWTSRARCAATVSVEK